MSSCHQHPLNWKEFLTAANVDLGKSKLLCKKLHGEDLELRERARLIAEHPMFEHVGPYAEEVVQNFLGNKSAKLDVVTQILDWCTHQLNGAVKEIEQTPKRHRRPAPPAHAVRGAFGTGGNKSANRDAKWVARKKQTSEQGPVGVTTGGDTSNKKGASGGNTRNARKRHARLGLK